MNKKRLPIKDFVLVHYGSSAFEKSEHRVYWIGAVYYENDQKKYFFADKDEKYIIESFAKLLNISLNFWGRVAKRSKSLTFGALFWW